MYGKYIEKIIDLTFSNSDFSYDRIMFAKKVHKIGQEVYKIGGYNGLFAVMELLVERLKEADYSNAYLGDFRECSFNGICDEFQV
jgi:hypothetical protein